MKGIRIGIVGICTGMLGIACGMGNFLAVCGAAAGLLLAVASCFVKDR